MSVNFFLQIYSRKKYPSFFQSADLMQIKYPQRRRHTRVTAANIFVFIKFFHFFLSSVLFSCFFFFFYHLPQLVLDGHKREFAIMYISAAFYLQNYIHYALRFFSLFFGIASQKIYAKMRATFAFSFVDKFLPRDCVRPKTKTKLLRQRRDSYALIRLFRNQVREVSKEENTSPLRYIPSPMCRKK